MTAAPVPAARSRHVATLLLVSLTAIWGSTFFLIRNVVVEMSPGDFLAVRFTIAAVAVLAAFWRPLLALRKREIQVGVGLGVAYAVAQFMQTVGLAHTEATRSGFITGTYVVLTPVLTAFLLRERIPSRPLVHCRWESPPTRLLCAWLQYGQTGKRRGLSSASIRPVISGPYETARRPENGCKKW